MMIEQNFPLYVLTDGKSGDVLVEAEEVEGFFAGPEQRVPPVEFLRVHEINKGRRRAEDAVLGIMNRQRKKVGEYFIGRVVLADTGAQVSGGRIPSVPCRFFGNRCEYPGAAKIWRRWVSDVAIEKGEWLQWPTSHHSAWLHVVQNVWFTSNRRAARYGAGNIVHLDGAQISTRPGFFCALGEAVNGPGGYFGSNLDALADCMSSNFGEGPPVKIVWQDFRASEVSLGRAFLESIIEVMREFRVDITIR